MKKQIFLVAILLLITHSCRKYEDGYCFNLGKPKKIVEGEWRAVKVLIDGIDKTYLIDSLNIDKYKFVIYDNSGSSYEHQGDGSFFIYDKQGNEFPWTCVNRIWGCGNELLSFYDQSGRFLKPLMLLPCYFNIVGDGSYSDDWKIHRLTNREMIISNSKWGINLEMNFEKIRK